MARVFSRNGVPYHIAEMATFDGALFQTRQTVVSWDFIFDRISGLRRRDGVSRCLDPIWLFVEILGNVGPRASAFKIGIVPLKSGLALPYPDVRRRPRHPVTLKN